ncbi:site-specific DNA-methyltransferase [Kocuria marina]|uniref:site-specific DNA-methyltransferase n=1 Tax=Kocuria marina TaxID=223184 RepID=UPI000BEF51FA
MSRLTELLRQARKADPQLGADLEAEVAALLKRRQFGLVFERHQPEAVELPGRAIRRGDKVRVLPPRGETKKGDQRLWLVERVERVDGQRVGHLVEIEAEKPEAQAVLCDDLVVVAEFKDRIFPGLVETGRVERGGPDKPFHTVINAENFHALEMLTYTHRGKVDAIYIDPPYNTGAKDWKYNNDYVEGDDDYRHSKWLAFMERRLEIAKELLNPDDSVLIVTIDEKEVHRLGLLLDQMLPEARTQMVSIVINHNGATRSREFSRTDEYAFFCFFGGAGPAGLTDPLFGESATKKTERVRWEWLMRGGSNSRRVDRPNLFYPVFVNESLRTIEGVGDPIPLEADPSDVPSPPGLRAVWPIRASGEHANWRASHGYLRQLLNQGYARLGAYDKRNDRWSLLYLGKAQIRRIEEGDIVVTGRDDAGAVQLKLSDGGLAKVPPTTWNRQRHNAGEYGSRLVKAFIPGVGFTFPKSLYAVEDALRAVLVNKPDACVLDFFAGSGTTAHAVMRLNKQDGGRRQCISVTNNEVSADEQKGLRQNGLRPGDPEWEAYGICDYITKPRVTAAITGKTPEGTPVKGDYRFTDEFPMADGFEENAAFFTLTYEDPLSVRHHRAFERIAPMLWLKAGSRGRIITDLGERGWDVAEAYGVVENIDQMPDFLARVEEVATVEMVFVVTDSDAAFQNACRDLPERVTAVRLYESYLHNYTINRRAGA